MECKCGADLNVPELISIMSARYIVQFSMHTLDIITNELMPHVFSSKAMHSGPGA